MPFERELIETSYQSWRHYILWGLHKTTGLSFIGERIQMKKWFLIWKEITRNIYQERRLAIQDRVFERWVSFTRSRRNYLQDLNKYFITWQVRTRNEKHIRKMIMKVLRERRLLTLNCCIDSWLSATQISSDNSRKFQTLLRDHILRRSTLRLPKILAMTPLFIVSKYWNLWRQIAIEKIGASLDAATKAILPTLSHKEIDDETHNTSSFTKDDASRIKYSNTIMKDVAPIKDRVTVLLQRKKESFSQSVKSVNDTTTLLKKAQHDVDVFDRSIKICTTEIENHCCICGGIHVFFDHEPSKILNCKRLKAKNRSLMYLKKARQEASGRMTAWRSTVKQCEKEREEARRSLSILLKESLFNEDELT